MSLSSSPSRRANDPNSTRATGGGSHPAVADPRIQSLARRVEVVEDPDFTRAFPARQPTEVVVMLGDGTELSERADFHRGEAENPHPPGAVRRKFVELAASICDSLKSAAQCTSDRRHRA